MKRLMSFILAAVMIFGLCGCGSHKSKSTPAVKKKYELDVEVSLDQNFLVATYNVDVYLDQKTYLGTVRQGGTLQRSTKTVKGKHVITLISSKDDDVKGKYSFDFDQPSRLILGIKAHMDEISVDSHRYQALKEIQEQKEQAQEEQEKQKEAARKKEEQNKIAAENELKAIETAKKNGTAKKLKVKLSNTESISDHDMTVMIDHHTIGTLKNGQTFEDEIDETSGEHTLTVADGKVKETRKIDCSKDHYYEAEVQSDEDQIELIDLNDESLASYQQQEKAMKKEAEREKAAAQKREKKEAERKKAAAQKRKAAAQKRKKKLQLYNYAYEMERKDQQDYTIYWLFNTRKKTVMELVVPDDGSRPDKGKAHYRGNFNKGMYFTCGGVNYNVHWKIVDSDTFLIVNDLHWDAQYTGRKTDVDGLIKYL